MARTWLITGCLSGFGRILAEAVLARGDNVAVTARDISSIAECSTANSDYGPRVHTQSTSAEI
jgi:NAD(P)-dependent dehydrogenase (short-subunit alcohol dehydrogenase family)